MKKVFGYLIFGFLFSIMNISFAHEASVDKLTVPFSDPSKPGFVQASLVNGGITVKGYNGKEVIVEAQVRGRDFSDEDEDRKSKGLKRIRLTSTGLTVEEEDNVMTVSTESWRRAIDLKIQVPFNTSLKLNCVNSGDIEVENVEGEFDIDNVNGALTLTDISGAVVAHALNKDLVITFKAVDPKKSMSFSSLNGDIDITFPKDLKATMKLKSDNGDIFSDFEISKQEANREIIEQNTRKKGGKYRIRMEEAIVVKVNGGGQEMQFKNFNGDIMIRKGK